MTVKELILELVMYNGEAKVYTLTFDGHSTEAEEVDQTRELKHPHPPGVVIE